MSGETFVTGKQIIVLTTSKTNHVCSILVTEPYNEYVKNLVSKLESIIQTSNNIVICKFLDPRFKQHAFTSQSAANNGKE